MIFDLGESEGEWFPFFTSRIDEKGRIIYDEPKKNAARFRIRNVGPIVEEKQAGRKRRAEFVLNPETRAMERVTYLEDQTPDDAKRDRDDIWDYAITGIEDACWSKGVPIECTRENKLKLMALPVFDRFMSRCQQLLASSGVKAAEEARKNG